MFSATVIGLLVSASVATWVYTKTMRQTGNNNKSSIITAVLAGVASFVIIVTIVVTIDKSLGN
jgi:hypothetical protein